MRYIANIALITASICLSACIAKLSIDVENLENLGDDYNYEGWLIVNGQAQSSGIFDIKDGKPDPSWFIVSQNTADNASTFVLTIEPEQDDDPAPSKVHILAGDISNGSAALTASHQGALGTDFSTATGSYILATPSNGNETPNQGIWFLDNNSGSAMASLSLPTLPEGWLYEGWVALDFGVISTGTFLSPSSADSDAGGIYAGAQATPAFPGQDFVQLLQIDLLGVPSKAVISVEPDPDNSPAPFSIKPLLGSINNDAMELNNIAADTIPAGTIKLSSMKK